MMPGWRMFGRWPGRSRAGSAGSAGEGRLWKGTVQALSLEARGLVGVFSGCRTSPADGQRVGLV